MRIKSYDVYLNFTWRVQKHRFLFPLSITTTPTLVWNSTLQRVRVYGPLKLLTDISIRDVPDRWEISSFFNDPRASRRKLSDPIFLRFFLQFLRRLNIKDASSAKLSRFSPRYYSELDKIEII